MSDLALVIYRKIRAREGHLGIEVLPSRTERNRKAYLKRKVFLTSNRGIKMWRRLIQTESCK